MKATIARHWVNLNHLFEKRPATVWLAALLWILAIGSLTFLWQLGSTGLVDHTEPQFAEAARQMTITGDWVTPYYNQTTRFDKPPLIYWLVAIAYNILGVNEWSARLPSALAAIALMGMVFYTLFRYGAAEQSVARRWGLGAIGSAMMALHLLTVIWGRAGVSDMLLSSCIGFALLTFFCGYCEAESRQETAAALQSKSKSKSKQFFLSKQFSLPSIWFLACYGCIGLAILTKGPIGLVLPGLIIAGFLLYVGHFWQVLRSLRLVWGLGIILAVALPWFVLVTLAHGQTYIDTFFGLHNISRFTRVVNRHDAPGYFYFGVVLVGFAPWSVYLPGAIARLQGWRRSFWRQQPRSQQLGLFALCWFLGVFGFFTIAATKLPSYVLPLMPAATILVTLLWAEQLAKTGRDRRTVGGVFNGALFLFAAVVFGYSPQILLQLEEQPQLAAGLQASGVIPAGMMITLVAAGAIALLLFWRRTRWLWLVNLVTCLALIIFILLPTTFLVDTNLQLPVRQVAEKIVQVHQPQEPIIVIGLSNTSLVFYTQQPIFLTRHAAKAVKHLQQLMAEQPTLRSALLVSEVKDIQATGLQPNQYQLLDQTGGYQLVRVLREAAAQLQP
jgi:4-amino-4-deoxy-L-arabinose transferase-like glycosyltransferase